ncbi:MAG TPA: [protein-PII] uridylyltransferase [Quisquiliibacterium sp.]|nr:[protein-PII] uridylyltransferase [Quisquiliibacterium sp.]
MTLSAVPESLAPLRTAYRRSRDDHIDAFRVERDPDRLTRRLSATTDTALRGLWQAMQIPGTAVLAAVGGYGRGETYPHSDVDLLLLTPEPATPEQAQAIERFVGACWDFGLPIGHSVRSLAECLSEAAGDITIQTSSMEARYLAGSRALFSELVTGLAQGRDPGTFFQEKMLEMRQRHVKFEDTPYSLEPNVKESPGGLRDLHVVMWTARAAGFGTTWRDLARLGLATEAEARTLRRNHRVLKRVRAMLHIQSGRREDRLVFDLQAQVAGALGLGGRDARRASEELMQRYFWAAKQVTQLTTILLQNLEGALFPQHDTVPEPIDEEFRNCGGLLEPFDLQLFERTPAAILRAFLTLAARSELKGMTAPTLRAIWHARLRIDAAFRRAPEHRALFLRILQQPRGITRTLRRMNQWSVLGRYLPAFRRIVGRMQHDLFHVYTVDQHILMVVRNLRRFAMDEHAHEYPFCSQLMASFDKPWLLYLSALFHDIAKGRGGDHSVLGKSDARRFCRAHGLQADETELVEFLVEHHLTMSSTAQKQDLSDPEVIVRFAQLVGTEQRLVALYLLTVADVRGTSPKVWNAWKGKLLQDLFMATKRALGGESPQSDIRLDALRREAHRILNLYALSEERYAGFWDKLDVAYFLRNDAQDIAWHTRVLHGRVDTREPVVRARLAPIGEGFQVVVYLPDQPDLFARICGYFDSRNLSVLDARIHTTRHGYALDSFLVIDPNANAHYRDILTLVEADLTERLKRRAELAPPVRGRISRRSRYFPIKPTVELRPDERGQHWLLSITANDRTGLLYSIARVLSTHHVNLYTARVSTLGERVEDMFLIDGPALAKPKDQLHLETALLEALQA